MTEGAVRVWFSTSDTGFGRVVSSALGDGFETKLGENESDSAQDPRGWCDVALLDLRENSTPTECEAGFRLIDEIRQANFPPLIIVMLADDNPVMSCDLIKAGAYDTIACPPNIVELRLLLRRAHRFRQIEQELRHLQSQQAATGRLDNLIGFSKNMQESFALAKKVAPCDVNVLILGETGTGKSMLARTIHRLSSRSSGPFVSFSCPNLQENLVEDELFGHEKGAFTGAIALRRGRFEAANGGTLFLDEIGDLSLGLQAKLLRVLQEKCFERLGSNTPLTVDIRFIGATHRNLEEMVKRGEFREDLYYRLNVIQVQLPPLRERGGETAVLAQHFIERFSHEFGKKARRLSRLALKAIEEYSWPGNVRELENVIQRAVVLSDGPAIEVWHLPPNLRNGFEQPQATQLYEEEVRDFKRRLVIRTLRECDGNKAETARTLGLARGYLHRLINELKIQSEEVPSVDVSCIQEEQVPQRVM